MELPKKLSTGTVKIKFQSKYNKSLVMSRILDKLSERLSAETNFVLESMNANEIVGRIKKITD